MLQERPGNKWEKDKFSLYKETLDQYANPSVEMTTEQVKALLMDHGAVQTWYPTRSLNARLTHMARLNMIHGRWAGNRWKWRVKEFDVQNAA